MTSLITRGDDIGMCRAANRGALDAVRFGCLKNLSLMATGPAIGHAAELLARVPGLCFGIHAALNCEWQSPRWGNVLPAGRVPSITRPDGTQYETPLMLHEQGYALDEAMAEIAAQLAKLRGLGFHIEYLDQHMGVGWIRGLGAALADFCAREGLIDADTRFKTLPDSGTLFESIAKAGPGPWVLFRHPCLPDRELDEFLMPGSSHGMISASRDDERLLFSQPRLLELIAAQEVRAISYPEAASTQSDRPA